MIMINNKLNQILHKFLTILTKCRKCRLNHRVSSQSIVTRCYCRRFFKMKKSWNALRLTSREFRNFKLLNSSDKWEN